MKLDIYREVRGDQVRPGMVIERTGRDPIDVDSVTVHRDGMIDLVGKPAYRAPASVKATTLRVRDTEVLRVHPTIDQVLGVWSSLCDAVRAASADFVERQELDHDQARAAAPWEVVGNMGQLLVVDRHLGFRIDPDLPIPEPADDPDPDEDGGG